jgi:cell division septation protein DedD
MPQDGASTDSPVASALPEGTPVLPMSDSVSVNIALFRSQQRANAVAAQLVDAGFPAFTRSDSEGYWHQVIVGPYVSAEEALAAQDALKAHGVAGTELRVQNLIAGEVGR